MNPNRIRRSAMLLLALATPLAGSTTPGRGEAPAPGVADRALYLAEVREELGRQWPDNRMVLVACHGHSVPTGYFRGGTVRPFDSYPHLTHVLVQERYPTGVLEFVRTGIGGEHAEQGAARFAEDVLAKKPDVVTIDYGLNDRAIGLERARAAWSRMIEQAQAAGVRVILLTPTPDTTADLDDPDDPLNRHAAQIRELAREHAVGLVDSAALFRDATERGVDLGSLMSQANHPNRRGHEIVAGALSGWFVPAG